MLNVRKTTRVAAIVGAVLLIALNITRMLLVPITCDESPSRTDLLLGYGDYVHLTKVTANIHILNSILRKASIDVLGNSPFALRLPNFFAQVLFLICSYAISRKLFKNSWWILGVFAALNLHPFLFEFWGYSRGYGLAVAFMTASIYCLLLFIESRKPRLMWLSLMSAMAAVWSNFALLNYYAALCGVLVLQPVLWQEWRELLRKVIPGAVIASVLLFLLIQEPIQKLRASGELYYGGDSGLFHDTLRSLLREGLYIGDPDKPVILAIAYTCIALIACSILYWALRFIKDKKSPETYTGIAFSMLLFIPLLSMKVQHKLLGTKYLIDRTALFLVVLFILQIVFWLYHFRPFSKSIRGISLMIIITALAYNFCWNITLHGSRMWWYDEHDLQAIKLIDASAGKRSQPIRLRTNWMHMPTLDYYVYTRYNSRFAPLEYIKEPPGIADTTYDYIFVYSDEISGIPPQYKLLHSFDGYNVYERKQRDLYPLK